MLIDSFPFNRDFRVLQIRLAEIGKIVDLMVISESPLTHSGTPKPLFLSNNQDVLGEFKKKVKIVHPSLNELSITNPRLREMVQRQAITRFLKTLKLSRDDFIFHSDCDEIPRAKVLQRIYENKLRGNYIFELTNFANALNLQDGTWRRGRLVSHNYYLDIQQLRKDIFLEMVFLNRKLPFGIFRTPDYWTRRKKVLSLPSLEFRPNMTVVSDAGWHFNNLMTIDEVRQKIEDSSHVEWNTNSTRDLAINRFIEGRDIYNGKSFDRVKVDQTYPDFIYKNLENWRDFIR